MSQLQQQKCVEAAAQLKQAEQALTRRSFFRGSPDYLSAAPLLDKAGELFRLGNDWEASKDAFRRCADAQQHNRLPFRAAQAWENVAKTVLQQVQAEESSRTMSSQKSRVVEAHQAFEKASGIYVDMNEFGDVLPIDTHACDLLEATVKPSIVVETSRKLQSFLVKYEK